MPRRSSSYARLSLVALLIGLSPRLPAQRATPVAAQRSSPLSVGVPAAATADRDSARVSSRRPWLRYPLIGAVVGGVGLQLHYLSYCTRDVDDGCMGGLVPLGFGAGAGAVVGGVIELLHRSVDRVRR